MHSLPSFLKRTKKNVESGIEHRDRNDIGTHIDNESNEKVQRGQSKRDYFRGLLNRSSIRSESRANQWRSDQIMTTNLQVPSPNSPEKPTTPMSDPNKPLPPPPAPGPDPEPPARSPKKLERIISPISVSDLHKLFSGAPQFFARSEGHHTGAPHPSVAFPWNIEVEIRDLRDHVQIQDEAWACSTAWPHITRDVSRSKEAVKVHLEKKKAHFSPRCRERPNMLSMQGVERGTVGYQAALEIGVADAFQEAEDNREDGGTGSPHDLRKKFLDSKDGVRPLSESTLIDHLINISTTYHEDPLKHRRPTVELYTELFTRILFPPTRVTDSDDPYSLQVQIEVLVKVLATPRVWFDFSLVEWRIRLGQILWGHPYELAEIEDDISIDNESVHEPSAQKFWLLHQILLSCELLIRLDALSQSVEHGFEAIKPTQEHRFEKITTTSVKWSLILARLWLENIIVERTKPNVTSERKPSSGWLATLTGTATTEDEVDDSINNFRLQGRYQSRQLAGLLHFARKLNWPDIETLAAKVSSNSIGISNSAQSTPAIGTPLSITTQRSSSYLRSQSRRPGIQRRLSTQQRVSAILHPAGWLSNSYFTGLILPGEGLSHFLISTLLENDDTAVTRLGKEANIYSGFVYCERSFWSTACIVGRVLAAGEGASECTGWIYSDITPRGVGEGWVNVDVNVNVSSKIKTDKDTHKARIWHKTTIEHDADVIGGADSSSVLLGDFTLLSDQASEHPVSITLQSLDFSATVDSVYTTAKEVPTPFSDVTDAPRIQTYSAMMRFSVGIGEEKVKEINFALMHDVHFVTAHPCIASDHSKLLSSPTSPFFQVPTQGLARSANVPICHPLHKAFTYVPTSLSAILSSSAPSLSSLLTLPPSLDSSRPNSTSNIIPKVLIIDCTDSTTDSTLQPVDTIKRLKESHQSFSTHKHHFGSDLEMLARALCAERGWNALISRRGRGCLSCAVREAGALGWAVVLRFA